jgi:putative FmdB family regulatory protein
MPIFEYVCGECGHQFERIVRGAEALSCPACASASLQKQLSVFAVNTKGNPRQALPVSPCGSCGDPRGPGACSMN